MNLLDKVLKTKEFLELTNWTDITKFDLSPNSIRVYGKTTLLNKEEVLGYLVDMVGLGNIEYLTFIKNATKDTYITTAGGKLENENFSMLIFNIK